MKKIFAVLLVAVLQGTVLGQQKEVCKLSDFTDGANTREVLYNTGFEAPFGKDSIKVKGYSVVREGINGSGALKITRTNPAEYHLFVIPLALQPKRKYTIEFYARGENFRRHKGFEGLGLICVEYYKNGKYITGEYPTIQPGTDWQKFKLEISTSYVAEKQFDTARLALYFRRNWTGTAWIDDLTVSSGGSENHAVVLNEPRMLTFRNGCSRVILASHPRFAGKLGAYLTLHNGGKVQELLLRADKNGVFTGEFGALCAGEAVLEIQLLDLNKKLLLEKQKFNLRVLSKMEKTPANAAVLDEYGRLIVDGKPFMPIGVYAGMSERSYKMIAEAGFNCLMGYNNFGMAPKVKLKSQKENILAMMDLMNQYGLKFIFNLIPCMPGNGGVYYEGKKGEMDVLCKVVTAVKDHPALLAYYIGDEQPLAAVPAMLAMREAINRLDVWHPSWVVSMLHQSYLFPQYGVGMDVGGVDIYPYGLPNSEHKIALQLKEHKGAYQRMNSAGLPHWCVPQIFNWGIYKAKDKEEYKKYRWPTLEEMRLQTILHAILGAKGFIYYSQFDILKAEQRFEPGITEKRWVMAKDITSMLHKLEPFLMGVGKVPEIKVTTDKKDNLQFRAFTSDDGKLCILAVAFEPVKAIFHVPGNVELRSQYGRFKKLGNGRWQFTADGIGSDILLPAN